MGDGQRHAGVLLHQQDGGAGGVQFLDNGEDLLHQQGSQTHGRLVQHQQLGLAHQGAAHGQHLLLTAGQGSGYLLVALLQAGKLLIDLSDGVGDLAFGAGIGTHLQILLHGELEEDPAPFGAERHALADDLVGGGAQQGGALKFDGAGAGLQQTADGVQGGGFAGAVRADQGDDLTLVYLKGNAFDGVDAAIVNLQIIDTQQTHVQPSLFLPR